MKYKGDFMNILDIIALVASVLPVLIGSCRILRLVLFERKKNKQNIEINIVSLDKEINLNNYSVLKNEFEVFQNPEDFKILNSGRDLCSDETLTNICVVDYCNNIIF